MGYGIMEVQIVDFPETKVAVIEHAGPPGKEHETAMKLIKWRIENRLPPNKHKSFGVHYNNPLTTPPEQYRVDFCVSIDHDVEQNSYGITNKVIPGGRCAKITHIGSRNNVTSAAYLFEYWLPASGEKLRDFPIFFHYVNVGTDIKEDDMITDVYLPIE